jgi:hypothetical protein
MGEDTRVSRVVVAIGAGDWSPVFLLPPKERRDRLFSDSSSSGASGGDWENSDSSSYDWEGDEE